ncbi:dienelactone hydrolase family protein [Novosphingobium tardum]|uniref:Dienelactone hydrolase family protein n=1 Tax=Novosphingobium tardum TaxID=1538021 RepID=A0ABV8RTM4_9SPHN
MCDEHTEAEDAAWLERNPMSRRQFGGTAAALAAGFAVTGTMAGCMTRSTHDDPAGLTEEMVKITTPDGTADAYFVHPGGAPRPGIIIWPDIGGLRDAFKTMGRRLAQAGYAVLVVNQYYRSKVAPVLAPGQSFSTPDGRAALEPMIARIDQAGTFRDTQAFVAFLDGQRAVDTKRKIGTVGYCMGGMMVVRSCAASPDRVGAGASCHGANLVTDKADSPHKLIAQSKASYLFAIAQNDDQRQPEAKKVLQDTCAAAGRPAEIEVYPAQHGWCTIDSKVYDQVQAERAWSRVLALFAKL